MIESYPESRIGGTPELLEIQARFRAAEDSNDAFGMAKCLADELAVRIAFEPRVDERQSLLAARAALRQTAPQLSTVKTMAKSLARPTVETKPAPAERHPSQQLELAQMRRDIAVAGSLAKARHRFAKAISQGNDLEALNSLNCQLSARYALAKSQSDRDTFSRAKQQLCVVAHRAGFQLSDDGSYIRPMAKAIASTSFASEFAKMHATLTQMLNSKQIDAATRKAIDALRTEVIVKAQAFGIRFQAGKFVPFAS